MRAIQSSVLVRPGLIFSFPLPLLLQLLLASCSSTRSDVHLDSGELEERSDPTVALCAHYQAAVTSPPSFNVIQQIFNDNCVSCHTAADLDLSDGKAWMDLVNQPAPAAESCGQILVTPGDPAASYLYQKLTNDHPCSGSQMPIDELFRTTPLPSCEIQIIFDWIEAGAPPISPGGDSGEG
jgi:hypothetical protein